MPDNDIKCPKCGEKIPIDDVLKHRLNEQVKSEVVRRLEAEKNKMAEDLSRKFAAEESKELKIYKEKLKFEAEKRAEAEKRELDFIRKQNDLEDKLKSQENIIARKLQEERKVIEEKIRREEEEKQTFALMELKKQLDDTKKSLAEAQRKAQQGSMQTQGEVLELTLENLLKKKFPNDLVEPVGKGISGADIIQKVIAANNEVAGIIAWESKQTKAWAEDWVTKLKDDGHRVKANLLVLVTNVLPKNIDRFGQYKGIWVADYASSMGLGAALRNNLLSVYSIALANQDSQDKAAVLYRHLTSQAFINRVQSISETYINMLAALEKEKNAMQNIWENRVKQIERLSSNTRHVFNEIGSIVGGQFSGLEVLEELGQEKTLEKPAKKIGDINQEQANLF